MTIEFDDLIPQNTDIRFDDLIPQANPVQPRTRREVPGRTLGTAARDLAAGVLQIGPTAIKGVADIGRLATGDRLGAGLSGRMERGMQAIREVVGSERAEAMRENFMADMADDEVGVLQAISQNPGAIGNMVLPTIGSMFLPVGAGVAGARLATAGKAVQGMSKAEIAARVARAQTVAGVGTITAQNAASTFAELVDQGVPMEDAYLGAAITVPFTVVAGALTRGGAEGAVTRAITGTGSRSAAGRVGQVGAAGLMEGGQEAIETVGQVTGRAAGSGDAPSGTAAAKEVAVAGLLGALMGGGVNVATQAAQRGQPEQPAINLTDYQEAARQALGQTTPSQAPAQPVAALDAEATNRILQAIERAQNVQNATPAARTQAPAQTAPVEAPAPAGSDATPAAVLPDAGGSGDVQAAGLTFDDLVPATTEAPQATTEAAPVTPDAPVDGAITDEGTKPDVSLTNEGKTPILQNRNRATPSSIAQMQNIAANPDYGRMGFSRDFANGAPVVAGGEIAPEQLGRQDVAVASDGRRIPVQYAVVEAADVLPSNQADGTPNPDYGNQAVQRIRAIAGNGRIAGLQAAYQQGNTAGYVQELAQDTLHGVSLDVIRAMRAPVLVRVMPTDQVTADIGDVSNTVGNLNLSAVEQANNDTQRVNLDALQFAEDGSITPEAVRQFVRAMPQAEQGGLIDTNGQPTKQAVDRINAAVFAKAYGNDQLVRLYAQAQDPEARNVLSALAQVAPKMARLEGAGALDIRDVVTQAAEIAVNARREGRALALAAQQVDMAADPMVGVVLELFARNARSVKPVVEALGNAADFAYTEATKPAADMFGEVPRASRADAINLLRPQNERASQENLEQPAGRGPVPVDAGRQAPEPAGPAGPGPTQAGRPAADQAADQPASQPALSSYTPEEVTQRLERLEQAEPVAPALTYTPASQIDSPTQGVLANAKERKARAFARLKAVRQQVKDGTANRLDLLKAESAHKDAVREVEAAEAQLERDANRLGLTTVREDAQDYNAEAPRRPYTDDRQLQLFLDRGPVESQAGAAAVAAQRAAVSAVDDIRSTGTILGLALSGDYAARQRVSLVGQKVGSAEDLAILAQVYRDPRFETFRVVFVNDSGAVVSQVGLTSRLPASVNVIIGNDMDGYLAELSATARNRGATGYYLLHNHPSGIATPSRADVNLTKAFASRMPMLELRSHVVIDTNEYSTIDGKGRSETLKKDFGQPAPYRAQEWADIQIGGPDDLMNMAKRLQVDDGAITLIHTNNQYGIKAITTMPASASTMDKQELRKLVVKASLQTQGAQVFAVGRDSQALRRIGPLVVDAIHVEDSGKANSLRSMGVIPGGSPYPENRRTRLSPDSSPEFNYLRKQPQQGAGQRAAEPDPQYSQAPSPSPHRDAMGRFKFRLGEVALGKLEAAAGPALDFFSMRMASPELRKQLRQMKATIDKAKRAAVDVAQEMSAMPEADRVMVSDIVEKMLAPGVIPPEHVVRVADAITRSMDAQTDELVELGMLSKDSAERWRGRYLPRIYNRQTELENDPLVQRLFKTGVPTMAGIGGGSLKGRGMFQDVSVDAVDQWIALGHEVRDPHWLLNQGKLELKDPNAPKAAREQVTVWRDWTPSERAQMGEMRDAMYRYVVGYTSMQRDIAVGRLFHNMANNPEWVRRSGAEGWLQVPSTEIADTGGVKRYGSLAGLWVRSDVMTHLTQFEEGANDALQLYREAMGLWKQGKTALNPVAHFNNIVSNLSMAHFAGVSYWDGRKYVNAVRDLIQDAPMVDEARDVGLFTGSFTREEMMQNLPPELQKMANMQESQARKGGRLVLNAMTFWLRKPLTDAYEAEDTFFKYLIYRDARQQGMEPAEAMDYALRYIFAYDDLPSGARKVRDFAIPFFSYTYKAVPALLHTAMVYPWRLAAPAALLHGINAVAYALAAGDEDDEWLEKLVKGRELEAEERAAMPDHTRGLSALGSPKTIRLGTDEITGLPVFLDASRIIPGGDIFDMRNQAGGMELPAPLTPNHPILSTFAAMLVNREMFLGRNVTDDNDTAAEKAEKRAKWMAILLLPAIAPGGLHSQRLMNATANAMDTVITTPLGEFTGVDRSGLPVQPKYAAMQTFGIKARPVDLELEAQRRGAQEQALVNSIAAEVRSMARLHQRGAVTDRMMEETRETAREKIERTRE